MDLKPTRDEQVARIEETLTTVAPASRSRLVDDPPGSENFDGEKTG